MWRRKPFSERRWSRIHSHKLKLWKKKWTTSVFVKTWRRRTWLAKNWPSCLRNGYVELLELKTSLIQCPSCLHHVFKGTIICSCGKHIRPDQEMIQRSRTAFDILETPYFRASHLNSWGHKHGAQLWQQHHGKAKDALRGRRWTGPTFIKKTRIRRSEDCIGRASKRIATKKECCSYSTERKNTIDKLDPEMRGYLEWLSMNWEEYFAKEREIPTSSSSCQRSSTSWSTRWWCWIGKDGNNTVGRISGQTRGDQWSNSWSRI